MLEDLLPRVLATVDPLAIVVIWVSVESVKLIDRRTHDPGRTRQRRSRGRVRRWYPLLPLMASLAWFSLVRAGKGPPYDDAVDLLIRAIAHGAVTSWFYRLYQLAAGKDRQSHSA